MKNVSIINCLPSELRQTFEALEPVIAQFAETFKPLEADNLYVLVDQRTAAIYLECHLRASDLLGGSTIDAPLDPEDQPEYRANRDIDEDNPLFIRMIDDAKRNRAFSNIVSEYEIEYDSEHPLKIIGGQHRYSAIAEAMNSGIDEYHGLKVYFGLDTEQRMDVQIISNTNIDVSPDLLDRVLETKSGPQLRNWCQEVGLLEVGEDFADKRQQGPPITVRTARTFIMNFYRGSEIAPEKFDKVETTPVIAKTGGLDSEWEALKVAHPEMWTNTTLIESGKEFALLAKAQQEHFSSKTKKERKDAGFAQVAYNYAVISAWALTAGVLSKNKARLTRHFSLRQQKNKDPLNAVALAEGRHKSDAEKYRGIATRYGPKERGRLAELFFAQAEKGDGISKALVELAITKYHAKMANLEVAQAEARFKE